MENRKQTDLQGDFSIHAQNINAHTVQISSATAEPANLWIPLGFLANKLGVKLFSSRLAERLQECPHQHFDRI